MSSSPGEAATVAVRVKPGASRTRVGGSHDGPHGPALVVAVNAPPVDGRATEAARRALAKALGVRPSSVALRVGAASRDKVFGIADPPPDLPERLTALLSSPASSGPASSGSALGGPGLRGSALGGTEPGGSTPSGPA